MRVVSIKLPADLDRELASLARERGGSRSRVVREALTALARSRRRTVAQLAGDLIGKIQGGSRDLASSPRHLAGYGR